MENRLEQNVNVSEAFIQFQKHSLEQKKSGILETT